jgi:hypothetical protein
LHFSTVKSPDLRCKKRGQEGRMKREGMRGKRMKMGREEEGAS